MLTTVLFLIVLQNHINIFTALTDFTANYGLKVLSYDDVYGSNPSIFFKGKPDVTIDLNGLDKIAAPVINATSDNKSVLQGAK